MMKRILFIGWTLVSSFLGSDIEALSPEEIIKRADEARNPGESFFLEVEIYSTENPEDLSLFYVAIKGNRTLVETLRPYRDRGRNLLMHNEDMWVYIPNLKRAVRVSLRQKLVGEAANGDISRMRWSGDYAASIEDETEKLWIMMLVAEKPGLTYERIRVWIEKESFHPAKAEYLTLGGKVLKNVAFTNYRRIAGKVRPTEIIIEDTLRSSGVSTIKILQMEKRSFPDALFHKNALGSHRLQP